MLKIGNFNIGYDDPVFVVAEIGINHNGNLDIAKKLILGAIEAGCNAVKFQKRTVDVVYTAEELARSRENPFGKTNGDLKRGLEFRQEEYDEINRFCKEKGILWFASPWDEESVEFLEQYNPPCYKIASACNLDRNLLGLIRSKGRPIIVSTGMTSASEVNRIVKFLGEEGLIILHCVATYPAQDKDLNLNNILTLIERYPRALVGYSGHEVGAYASLVAAAMGACVIERHITLDRAMWGTDQAASLELGGLKKLVKELRSLKNDYLGSFIKSVLPAEIPVQEKLRRSKTL